MLWAYYASTVLFFGTEFVRMISEEEKLGGSQDNFNWNINCT
jgi:uncharacterized BrkB/YihY/UPF0761 family membrane protein